MKSAITVSLDTSVLACLKDAAEAENRPVSQVANAWLTRAAKHRTRAPASEQGHPSAHALQKTQFSEHMRAPAEEAAASALPQAAVML